MRRIIRALMFALLLLPSFAVADTLPGTDVKLTAEKLTFSYAPWESGEVLACKHEILNVPAQDWSVVCTSADGATTKKYTVHLWVTAYNHQQVPKLSYEVLYWVTEWPSGASNGTTAWFHLRDATSLYGLDIRQSVDNDTAGLYLTIDLSGD